MDWSVHAKIALNFQSLLLLLKLLPVVLAVLAKSIQAQNLDRSSWHELIKKSQPRLSLILFSIFSPYLSLPLPEFQKKSKAKKVETENLGN